ncbi:glycosyltransferase [Fertoebacter nigrum]|uniref:Glycosyltransferase n=1 Tax=Fertoeibacter niger TaxID=2656921 RepID=A0A8X8H2S7_9RHOB|nr:glycosyltransferase [Fertoeibacter niger]NUB46075.1 glycosyltransferase [Fertoeibacter niger]
MDKGTGSGPGLLLIAPAPVVDHGQGRLTLDVKFTDGMRRQAALWAGLTGGKAAVVLWRGTQGMPFGAEYAQSDLGFDLILLPQGAPLPDDLLAGRAVVAASADMPGVWDLPQACATAGAALVYTIEYTLQTRLQIVGLDASRGVLRKGWSALWTLRQERQRRRAFRRADAVQANGFPAFEAYRGLNADTLLYLDSRIGAGMLATGAEMQARAARLQAGAALRLVHSGRLEPMKGAQDLLPVARALATRGVDFTLDIFGTGSLAPVIAAGMAEPLLAGRVRLHDPVDFDTVLVPHLRTRADLFLSCHRQADPSCTYLESMGCGLPVAGYDNAMWQALMQASGAGWAVPLGDIGALAAQVAALAAAPDRVLAAGQRAWAYASAHDFETEFALRMQHMAAVLQRRQGGEPA